MIHRLAYNLANTLHGFRLALLLGVLVLLLAGCLGGGFSDESDSGDGGTTADREIAPGTEDFDIGAERVLNVQLSGDIEYTDEAGFFAVYDPQTGRSIDNQGIHRIVIEQDETGYFLDFNLVVTDARYLILEYYANQQDSTENANLIRSSLITLNPQWLERRGQASAKFILSPLSSVVAESVRQLPFEFWQQQPEQIYALFGLNLDTFNESSELSAERVQLEFSLLLTERIWENLTSDGAFRSELFRHLGTAQSAMVQYDDTASMRIQDHYWEWLKQYPAHEVSTSQRISSFVEKSRHILEESGQLSVLADSAKQDANTKGDQAKAIVKRAVASNSLVSAAQSLAPLMSPKRVAEDEPFRIYSQSMITPVKQSLQEVENMQDEFWLTVGTPNLPEVAQGFSVNETTLQNRLTLADASLRQTTGGIKNLPQEGTVSEEEWEQALEAVLEQTGAQHAELLAVIQTTLFAEERETELRQSYLEHGLNDYMSFEDYYQVLQEVSQWWLLEFTVLLEEDQELANALENQLESDSSALEDNVTALGDLMLTAFDLLATHIALHHAELWAELLEDPQHLKQFLQPAYWPEALNMGVELTRHFTPEEILYEHKVRFEEEFEQIIRDVFISAETIDELALGLQWLLQGWFEDYIAEEGNHG